MLLASSLCLAAHNRSCNAQDLERWVYVSANFLLPAEVNRVEQLMKECRPPGYTHLLITDSKFCRLKELDKRYFQNIARIAATAKQLDLKLVPAVFPVGYSNSLLSQNVNMAEGLPVRNALFEIHGKEATLVADPVVSLPRVTDRKQWNFIDQTLQTEGDSLRATEPQGENCRIMKIGANLALSTLPRVHSHPDRELQRAASDHSAGYYDADAEQIGKWLDTVKKSKISNVIGVMYTTWKQDYSHLKDSKMWSIDLRREQTS